MKFSAYVGPVYRARIEDLAARWGCTLSQAVRRIAIRGLGGDESDVYLANEEAEGRRQELAERVADAHPGVVLGYPRGGPRGAASLHDTPPSIVTCAFPRHWTRRIRAAGGLKPCVLAGLAALGEAD